MCQHSCNVTNILSNDKWCIVSTEHIPDVRDPIVLHSVLRYSYHCMEYEITAFHEILIYQQGIAQKQTRLQSCTIAQFQCMLRGFFISWIHLVGEPVTSPTSEVFPNLPWHWLWLPTGQDACLRSLRCRLPHSPLNPKAISQPVSFCTTS